MKVVIPFVQINAHNPNLSLRNFSSALNTYFECIVVAFTSLKQWNPNLKLQLTTNLAVKEPYSSQLNELSVEIKIVQYMHNPPSEFGETFRGCFYLFDAIIAEDEDVLYIDPDVLCVGSIPLEIFEDCVIGALDLQFADSKEINGISPLEARKIYSQLLTKQIEVSHKHFGGEAIYISRLIKNSLVSDIDKLWIANVSAGKNGKIYLPTEEHILSLIFSNYAILNLDFLVLRIWTTMRYRKVEGGIFDKQNPVLWHLPSEKSFGFHKAYQLILKDKLFKYNSDSANRNYCRKIFGVNRSLVSQLFNRIVS